MKSNIASVCLAVGALLAPFALQAAEPVRPETDRMQPREFVKDSVITSRIKARLAEERVGSVTRVHVATSGRGVVVLSGRVHSREEAARALSIARSVEGVTRVSSRMRIRARKEPA